MTPLPRRTALMVLGTLAVLLASLAALSAPGDGLEVSRANRKWLTGAQLQSDLLDGLAGAEERILVVMFLMSSSEVADHPVHRLVEKLAEARARGVDVLVILDETYHEKNATAWRQLTEAGVDVRWDDPNTLTHSKLVLVDDDVWVGSANWTASALTGGNLESTVRLRNRSLADRLYDVRLAHQTSTESRVRAAAADALRAEAHAALTGPDGGMLRRNLEASGLDPDALAAAGMGATVGDPAIFRTRVLARLGVGTGWNRWGYKRISPSLLVLPSQSGRLLVVDAENWTVVQGDPADLHRAPAFDRLRTRIRGGQSAP